MGDSASQMALATDGSRLHLQHGPIDLIIECDGAPHALSKAHKAATECFDGLLEELVIELATLRAPVRPGDAPPAGPVARRMFRAVSPFAEADWVSPMAAVAGAVADAVGEAMAEAAHLDRWMVNNGGDIAFGLTAGECYRVGLVADPRRATIESSVPVEGGSGVGGAATSGWHGRSLSLGIADAVTVFASTAALADAAATIIANRVDVGPHPAVVRQPASELDPDSDLGDTQVTIDVGVLSPQEVHHALDNGLAFAEECVARGLIKGAVLHLANVRATTASKLFVDVEPMAAASKPGAAAL